MSRRFAKGVIDILSKEVAMPLAIMQYDLVRMTKLAK